LLGMRKEYENTKKTAQQYRTGKLWLQYMEMISILKQFIQAEKEGDWKGPLKTVSKMLSYFAAAGQLVPESLAMFICKKCLDWKKVTLQFTQHSWMETSL